MTLTVVLICAGLLLALGILAVIIGRAAAASRVIYGASIVATTVSFAAALAHLLGVVPAESLSLPVGLPWLGAHFRLDALSALFLAVVDFGAASASLFALGYGRHEARPDAISAVLPGVSRRHVAGRAGRRCIHVSRLLGVYVADLVGAGRGAPSCPRQRPRRLCLSGHGGVRHAHAAAGLRPLGRTGGTLRVRADAHGATLADDRRACIDLGADRRRLQGRHRPAACLAAARASGGAEPRLGANERRDDQGRRLRFCAHRFRTRRPAGLVVERHRARTCGRHDRHGRALRAHAARSQTPARLSHGREYWHNLHRPWLGARLSGAGHALCRSSRIHRRLVARFQSLPVQEFCCSSARAPSWSQPASATWSISAGSFTACRRQHSCF